MSHMALRRSDAAMRDVPNIPKERGESVAVIAQKTSLQQTIQHHKKQKSLFLQPFHPSKFMKMRKNLIHGFGDLVESQ